MITFLIGLLIILGAFSLLYILGIIPNLYSSTIISYTSLEDVLERGAKNLAIIIIVLIFILFIYMVGKLTFI